MPTFTQAELDQLCRSPHDRLREAFASSADDAVAVFTRLVALVRDIADLYARWSVCTLEWARRAHGLDAAATLVHYPELWPADAPGLDTESLALVRAALRGPAAGLDSGLAASVADAAHRADATELLALWDEVHAAVSTAEALRRDAVTAQLSLVTRRYGADGLEQCLRHATDEVWLPRMAADLANPPEHRVRAWAEKMAVGHGGAVRLTEHDDRWVITLDPCGSCGRQLLAGRYEPPWDFAMSPAGSPVAFGRDDVTVYQAHLAVAHTLVPIERTGAPWPAITCAGRAARPCELVLYRDPAQTPEAYYAQVGLSRATGQPCVQPPSTVNT